MAEEGNMREMATMLQKAMAKLLYADGGFRQMAHGFGVVPRQNQRIRNRMDSWPEKDAENIFRNVTLSLRCQGCGMHVITGKRYNANGTEIGQVRLAGKKYKLPKSIRNRNLSSIDVAELFWKDKLLPIEEFSISESESDSNDSFANPGDYILPRPADLTEEQEDILEKNLVWVIGTFRSGTTWLGTQLLSHNTWTVDESEIGMHLGSMNKGDAEKSLRDIDNYKYYEDYFFAHKFKKTWMRFLRKLILNRLYAQFQDFSKKIVIRRRNGDGVFVDTL